MPGPGLWRMDWARSGGSGHGGQLGRPCAGVRFGLCRVMLGLYRAMLGLYRVKKSVMLGLYRVMLGLHRDI